MTTTPNRIDPTWRVVAFTTAGHAVALAADLSEEEARDMRDDAADALLHIAKYGPEETSHILHGPIGVVRLDAVQAVQIRKTRKAIR